MVDHEVTSPHPSISTMSTAKITETLRKTLSSRPPYLSGTCSIPGDEFKLYYDVGDDAQSVPPLLYILVLQGC